MSRHRESLVETVKVKSGRHIDAISLIFPNGIQNSHGNFSNGEQESRFSIEVKKLEYIVRIVVREGEHLDGIQFFTNYGRVSPWIGGSCGDSKTFVAPKGEMITNLTFQRSTFCPRIQAIVCSTAPRIKTASLKWLMSSKSTRKLLFSGKPSISKLSKRGKPSVFSILFSGKPKLVSLMMKGDRVDNPSIMRLFLTGEQNELQRFSLLRLFCDKRSCLRLPERNILQVLFESGNESQALIRYLFVSKEGDSIIRALTLNGQNKLFLKEDRQMGFPSLMKLLLLPDVESREEEVLPSIMELLTYQEQSDSNKESLLRLLLKDNFEKESIFKLLMKGRNSPGEEGDTRSVVQMSMEMDENGFSSLRRLITPNRGYKGYSPSIFNFALKGEERGDNSIFRLLLQGEEEGEISSLFRLMAMIHDGTQRNRNKAPLQLKIMEIVASLHSKEKRNSILQLMMDGKPSIMDLILEGELTSDHSLARLFLGLNFAVVDSVLRVEIDYTNERASDSLGLMGFLLMGEERGGPGTSFLRLLLHGEESTGFSVMRLLLMNENENIPSLMRIGLVAQKAFLLGLKQRKSDSSQWRQNLIQMKNLIERSQKQSFGDTFSSVVSKVVSSVKMGISKYAEIIEVLKTIPARGKEFEEMWQSCFISVAEELERINERVKDEESPWKTLAPLLSVVLREIADQQWISAFQRAPNVISAIALLVEDYTDI